MNGNMVGLGRMTKTVNIDTSEETSDTNVDENGSQTDAVQCHLPASSVRSGGRANTPRASRTVWPGPHSAGSRRGASKEASAGPKSSRDSGKPFLFNKRNHVMVLIVCVNFPHPRN